MTRPHDDVFLVHAVWSRSEISTRTVDPIPTSIDPHVTRDEYRIRTSAPSLSNRHSFEYSTHVESCQYFNLAKERFAIVRLLIFPQTGMRRRRFRFLFCDRYVPRENKRELDNGFSMGTRWSSRSSNRYMVKTRGGRRVAGRFPGDRRKACRRFSGTRRAFPFFFRPERIERRARARARE